eukprot:TRINITY_DN25364_c0_g1_i1.p1 TRINITY_DN25364_c0_g1~~TRINITY_DN25364_c0_g1_i1.p1  ORF type:complete len:366 (+),score=84.64 TRINITY_DN25364_c0_g1_i1:169-1266(+)
MSHQVEVQAPPGLDNSSDPSQTRTKSEEELKEELIKEVTMAIKGHVDQKTSEAVEQLWLKGQKAIQYMQTQHMTQTDQLRSQLASCAESYKNLERENAMLRSGLEALMKHLTVLFGTPPHGAPGMPMHIPKGSPFFPPHSADGGTQKMAPGTPVAPGTPSDSSSRAPAYVAPSAGLMVDTQRRDAEASRVPADPRQSDDSESEAEELLCAPAPTTPRETSSVASAAAAASGGTGSEQPASASAPTATSVATAPAFTLTLRRADTVPVGLDVRGEEGYLVVERVRPGGAVEAWNRQCPGDVREIRPFDRICMINGAEDPDSMMEECRTKHLLKMTVLRGSAAETRAAQGNLRADASEFVPQGVPRS